MPDITPRSALVTRFQLVVDKVLAYSRNGAATQTVTLRNSVAGVTRQYVTTDDGSADSANYDFLKEFADQLAAALGGGATVATTMYGATSNGLDDATPIADGRIRITVSGGGVTALSLLFADPLTTLDPRLLGFPAATRALAGTPLAVTSDYVCRHTWWPQSDPAEDLIRQAADRHAEYAAGGRLDGADWGEREEIDLAWDSIPSALARIRAAADSSRIVGLGLTLDDPNCAYERWALDAGADATRDWYYYPDVTSDGNFDWGITTRHGPFRFRGDSPLWSAPLSAPSTPDGRAGEHWTLITDGRTVVTLPTGALAPLVPACDEGRMELLDKAVTEANTVGVTTKATATGKVWLAGCVLYSTGANTGGVSYRVDAATSQRVLLISPADALQANLDAVGKQVSWSAGSEGVALQNGETVAIRGDAAGSGAAMTLRLALLWQGIDGGSLS